MLRDNWSGSLLCYSFLPCLRSPTSLSCHRHLYSAVDCRWPLGSTNAKYCHQSCHAKSNKSKRLELSPTSHSTATMIRKPILSAHTLRLQWTNFSSMWLFIRQHLQQWRTEWPMVYHGCNQDRLDWETLWSQYWANRNEILSDADTAVHPSHCTSCCWIHGDCRSVEATSMPWSYLTWCRLRWRWRHRWRQTFLKISEIYESQLETFIATQGMRSEAKLVRLRLSGRFLLTIS